MQKALTIYELDFGLNHVVKKSSEKIPSTAHMLLPGNKFHFNYLLS